MNNNKKRVESIDALRAFALFGVIMVHVNSMYSFIDVPGNDFSFFTPLGLKISNLVFWLFDDKSRTIFSTLFGVSFYFILRNRFYSNRKFCWRCILLVIFGSFNKIISTNDILVWYGLNGIILSFIPVRKMAPKWILIIGCILFFVSLINFQPSIGHGFPPRYSSNTTIIDIITYPFYQSLLTDLYIRITVDGTATLACFMWGYYLGKSGIIDIIDDSITYKKLILSILLFIASLFIYKFSNYNIIIWKISVIIGAVALSITMIFTYNNIKPLLSFMSKYGKLGLTHYSSQYIIGTLMVLYIAIPSRFSIEYVFVLGIGLYSLQTLFSLWWIKKHRYGPLEWVWRIATNLKYESNKKDNT